MPELSEVDECPSSPENQDPVCLRLSASLIMHCRQFEVSLRCLFVVAIASGCVSPEQGAPAVQPRVLVRAVPGWKEEQLAHSSSALHSPCRKC